MENNEMRKAIESLKGFYSRFGLCVETDFNGNSDNELHVDVASRVFASVYRRVENPNNEEICELNSWIYRILEITGFKISEVDKGKISLYDNSVKRNRGIRTRLNAGRALNRLFPFVQESKREEIADVIRERYFAHELAIEILRNDPEAFAEACKEENFAPFMNPRVSRNRKSLATSCMRYSFSRLPAHPMSIYSTPDFEMIVARNANGQIAARVVLMVARNGRALDNPRAAPIYGVSDKAIDAIESELRERNAVFDYGFNGARLRKVVVDGDYVVVPYLDNSPCRAEDFGDCLVISDDGEIDCSNTSGYSAIDDSRYECECCGERLHEDETFCGDNDGIYCESCYHDNFVNCEHCGDSVRREDTEIVNIVGYRGRCIQEVWCGDCARNDAFLCEHSQELWSDDFLFEAQGIGDISRFYVDNGEIVQCEESGDYILAEESGETVDGRIISLCILRNHPSYQLQSSGLWEDIQLRFDFSAMAAE
jgi:hypothetical protein